MPVHELPTIQDILIALLAAARIELSIDPRIDFPSFRHVDQPCSSIASFSRLAKIMLAQEIEATLARLRAEAAEKLDATCEVPGRPRVRVLLTGGTGFVGKEIIWQAAKIDEIAEIVVVIRPKTIKDRKAKLDPELLQRLRDDSE